MKTFLFPLIAAIAALVSLPTTARAEAPAETTSQVWAHHLKAWSSHDLDAILEDYRDDATVVTVDRVYRGKTEIRGLFAKLFALFESAEEQGMSPAIVEGQIVYITWHVKVNHVEHPVGTDTFVVQEGKIAYQTITSDKTLLE